MIERLSTGGFVQIKRGATWLVLLLPQALVFLFTQLRFPMLNDEILYHLPSILIVRDGLSESVPFLRLIASHKAANGPLAYLIFWAWGRVVGFEPEQLRIASMLFGAGSVILFYVLLRHLSAPQPIAYSWLFTSWPYFLLYSNTLLVFSIHTFFLIGALFAFYKGLVAMRANGLWVFVGAVSSALAILTRQTGLPIVGALTAYLIVRAIFLKRPQSIIMGLLSLVSYVALLSVLVLAWQGLVPPGFQEIHHITISPEALFLFGTSIAVFFAPLIPLVYRTRGTFVAGIVIGIAYVLQLYQGASQQPLATSKGIVPFFFSLTSHLVEGIPLVILQLILAALGLAVAWRIVVNRRSIFNVVVRKTIVNDADELAELLRVAAVASLPAALFTNRLYELYLITTYPWLLALSARVQISRNRLLLWLICQMAVAIAYFWVRAYLGI